MRGTVTFPKSRDVMARIGPDHLYAKARDAGQTLSAYLEEQDPSPAGGGLDAFERCLYESGIKTRSDIAGGYIADTFERFYESAETRSLIPEWILRTWRQAATRQAGGRQRALFGANDQPAGTALNQIVFAPEPVVPQIAPAIPLAEVISMTTPVAGGVYEAFYLTNDTNNQRMVRVGQGAEIPRAKLTGGDHVIRMKKYGRAVEITYEALRRMRIDMVALYIQRLAIQAEMDKVGAALDVLVNGDGNSGTAATNYNLTTLDTTAIAGTLTLKGWLAFKLQFANPYAMTTALVQSATALQMELLSTGSANIPLSVIQGGQGLGQFQVINPQLADGVRLGITTDAPTLKVVGFDKRFALNYLLEVGSDIQEIERFIMRQVQALVISENNAFQVLDPNSIKTLNVNA